MRALRQRLRTAFASVTTPSALAERIQQAASAVRARGEAIRAVARPPRPIVLQLRRHAWQLAAVAAMLLIAVPFIVFFAGPSPATAAPQELAGIHRNNLTGANHRFVEDQPDKMAAYFKEQLGFVPAIPKMNQGMAIRGCCVAHFRDKIAGSYVVNTPHGLISIIVVTDDPASLGLTQQTRQNGLTIWQGGFAKNRMAAVRLGNYTYTAVGEVSQATLDQLLGLLVSD